MNWLTVLRGATIRIMGNVMYVTVSHFLVRSSQKIYSCAGLDYILRGAYPRSSYIVCYGIREEN